MQYINHGKHNLHPLFNEFDKLYALTSEREQKQRAIIPTFDKCFIPIFKVFESQGYWYDVKTANKACNKRIQSITSKKSVIVCFSGGKDSTATAMWFKQHNYTVILYHLKGINKTYKDEYKTAQRVAEELELPIVTEDIFLTGKQCWTEHPMKNMIIANRALQYGIENNLTTKIAFGNFSTSSLENDVFEICGGDCAEMWRAYEKVIRTIIPRFKIYTPLTNMNDTISILVKQPNIAVLPQSCIGAYRYREYLRQNNSKKYGISVPKNRCGSCWKCCLEYIIFCDYEVYTYNQEYYKHCLEILKKTLQKENGIRLKRLEDVWHGYCFYNIGKSKYFNSHINKYVV